MHLGKKLTYANVMSTLCLFLLVVGVGGTAAYAHHGKITSSEIAKQAVKSKHIKNNNVKSVDIKNNNVKSKDVRDGTLRAADLANGAVTRSKLHTDVRHRFARVNSGAEILSMSGVTSVTHAATGQYDVVFDRNVAGCAVLVTTQGSNGSEGVTYGIGGDNNVRVFVRDTETDVYIDREFSIAALC